jgi:serine/threonine protein kinase
MSLFHETATEEELVSQCAWSNPTREVLHELQGGHSVVKISKDVAVKYGFGITEDEAKNQMQAYTLIDQTIIRVPQVYRFFTHADIGYIVMEYMDGELLNSTENSLTCDSIVRALTHFSHIQNDHPGPLGGGTARGLLWIHGDWISPTSTDDIEHYFNTRQLQTHQKLNLNEQPFVLCHLDIAPRNILKLKTGELCFLDWASAGFYPRFFEICAMRLNARAQNDCNNQVLCLLPTLDKHEEDQAQLLEKAYYLGQKHA